MTTDLAFSIMICTRGIYRKLGVTKGTVAAWRHNFKTGKYKISLDRKIELLQKAGFVIIQDTHWTIASCKPFNERKKSIDYLNDFPGLTLIGKTAKMQDEVIRRVNKKIIENPKKFTQIYKLMI